MNTSTKVQNYKEPYLELDINKVLFKTREDGTLDYETWKDIPQYEKIYQVSSFGRVKSLERIKKRNHNRDLPVSEKILKQQITNTGYLSVGLKLDSKDKKFQVHQLVAMAFLGHTPNGHKKVVDHKNNMSKKNDLDNLQIITNRQKSSKDKKGYTSKYVGVSWHFKREKWRSQIYHNGKDIHLGYFTNQKTASQYYKDALKSIKYGTEIQIQRREPVSKVKGITYRKDTNKWQVRVSTSYGRKSFGVFKTEEIAIQFLNFIKNNLDLSKKEAVEKYFNIKNQ